MRACLVQLHWTKHLDPLKNKSIPQRQHFTQPIRPTGRQRAPAPPPFHSAEPLPPSISPKSYIHVLSVYLKRNEPRAAHPKKAGNHPVCRQHLVPTSLPRNLTNQLTRFPVLLTLEVVHRKQSIPPEENTSHTHCGRARLTPYYRDHPLTFRRGYGTVRECHGRLSDRPQLCCV